MQLNEYILITCGNKTGVFIGSEAEKEAFQMFCNIMDDAISFLGNKNLHLTIGYNNVVYSVEEYKQNKKIVFNNVIKYGYIHYGVSVTEFELHVFVKGCYRDNIFN